MIDYSKFRMSPERLEEQNENYPQGKLALSDLDREGIAGSAIQRFITCYDCLWRVLKRHVTEALGIAETSRSPRSVFRLAHENDLFAAQLEPWLRYADPRTHTFHDYDGEKAQACLALVPVFVDDAIGLYQTMSSAT